MRIIDPGHKYGLTNQGKGETFIQFYKDEKYNPDDPEVDGPINQEYIRALINRVQFLDSQKPWPGNQQIIHHAREMLRLHELRAYEMWLAKQAEIEKIIPCADGHISKDGGLL